MHVPALCNRPRSLREKYEGLGEEWSTCPTAQTREVVLLPVSHGSLKYGELGANWWGVHQRLMMFHLDVGWLKVLLGDNEQLRECWRWVGFGEGEWWGW